MNSGVNSFVSTGAMFSMTLCFASTSQAAMTTAPATPHGMHPLLDEPAGIQADRAEDAHRERDEHRRRRAR